MSSPGWFEVNFPWIGAVAAAVLLVLLFGTNLLRADPSKSRWRDYTWLSWMAMAAYLLHNLEEYGIDMRGRSLGFPKDIASMMALPQELSFPPVYYVAVNFTAFWIAAPLAALLSRRHPLVGFSIYGIIFINVLAHVMPLLFGRGYGAGTLTAVVIFLPLSIWVVKTCFGSGRMSYGALALLVAGGIVFSVALGASMKLYIDGNITLTAGVMLQVANPFVLMLLLLLGEKWNGGALIRPLTQGGKASAAAR